MDRRQSRVPSFRFAILTQPERQQLLLARMGLNEICQNDKCIHDSLKRRWHALLTRGSAVKDKTNLPLNSISERISGALACADYAGT